MVTLSEEKLRKLSKIARRVRRHIIEMIATAGSGHPGGALSATEIVVALYFEKLRHNPRNPIWEDRDRFILSKGHACSLLYAVLAECGYYQVEMLKTFRKLGSPFQGHPCRKKTIGVEVPSGSLGQGISAGIGMALAGRLDKKNYRVYVLIGDGESQEGQIWEAAMAAAHYKLDNLCVVLDYNNMQIDGQIPNIMGLEPIRDKWRAFGWHVINIDGHNWEEILYAFDDAENTKGKPSIIIAHTIKGKGVSFMERQVDWHGKAPTREEAEKAIRELSDEN
jgi:transketolase